MPPKKQIISDSSLELLRKTLEEHKAGDEGEQNSLQIDPTDGGNIIAHLVNALFYVTQEVQRLKGSSHNPLVQQEMQAAPTAPVSDLKDRLRLAEDEVDEGRQRQLKGNLILSSNKKGQLSLIKTSQELQGQSLIDHINELLVKKYGVSVPEADIQACHHLPNGDVVLRIWRRTEGSAWTRLVAAIRTKPLSDINFWANFHLTGRRNEILYQLRQLKKEEKEGRSFKYFTDENGVISIKFSDSDVKYKLTFHRQRGNAMKTFTKQEIFDLFKT